MINKDKLMPTIVIVILLGLIGGTSAFAEKSLPGDLLYWVKININEPAAGIFAFTKEEKTEWQEHLVERRLEEKAKLMQQNKLDNSTELDLEDKIEKHIDKFNIIPLYDDEDKTKLLPVPNVIKGDIDDDDEEGEDD